MSIPIVSIAMVTATVPCVAAQVAAELDAEMCHGSTHCGYTNYGYTHYGSTNYGYTNYGYTYCGRWPPSSTPRSRAGSRDRTTRQATLRCSARPSTPTGARLRPSMRRLRPSTPDYGAVMA